MPLGTLLSRVSNVATDVVDAVRALGGAPVTRRSHSGPDRIHLQVRGLHLPGAEQAGEDLRTRLSAVNGVSDVEVNAVLGRVAARHAPGGADRGELADVVSRVEAEHGLAARGQAPGDAVHPGNPDALLRDVGALGISVLGFGYAAVAPLLPVRPLTPLVTVAVALTDSVPWLRSRTESALGRTRTEFTLSLGGAVAQGLSQNPLSLFTDLVGRTNTSRDAIARHQAWHRWEREHAEVPGVHEAPPLAIGPRPAALPDGIVERVANVSGTFALSGYGTVLAATRDPRRALATMQAGVPRPAKSGREAFATQLTASACARGGLVLEPRALRRLDRIGTVVLDAAALLSGRHIVEDMLVLDTGFDPARLFAHAGELVDPDAPRTPRTRGRWSLAPHEHDANLPESLRDAARAQRERGAELLVLSRDAEPVGIAVIVPELDPLAEALVGAAGGVGSLVLADDGSGLDRRLPIGEAVPGGDRLVESVHRLQQDGRVVAVVSHRASAALAAADVGLGITEAEQAVPWGADVLCPNQAEAHTLLSAVPPARTASRQAAALSIGGSCLGVLFSALGPSFGAPARAAMPMQAATLFALGTGTLAGLQAGNRPPPAPREHTPWHALPGRAVLRMLSSSMDGLSAATARRLQRIQPDQTRSDGSGALAATLEGLVNPMSPVLVTGAVLSAGLGSVVDALLIVGALGISAAIDGVQRAATDRELAQLLDAGKLPAHVRRDGEGTTVPADELVAGDVVELRSGDGVPADCRVLTSEFLEVDESSLTGESDLVVKTPEPTAASALGDRTSMVYQGTTVATGTAATVVVATGTATELGRTTHEHEGGGGASGGVQARLTELTRQILPLSVGAGGALFLVDLLRGVPLGQTVGRAVGLAVAAVPEGLPFVATLAELASARRLSRRGVLVRSPETVEALGRVDVLCFDKTGTLTRGRLTLGQVSDGRRSAGPDVLEDTQRRVVEVAARANPQADEEQPLPHPTDRAVLDGALRAGADPNSQEVLADLPFEPARSFHATRTRGPRGISLHVKGSPEVVLDRCALWRHPDGDRPFDGDARAEIEAEIERMALRGYRLLAVAEKSTPDATGSDLDDSDVDDMALVGLIGLSDPVQPTAADAVGKLQRAGVDVVMITGDHPSTAQAIAAELGMLGGRRVLHGGELEELDDEQLAAEMPKVSVFARVSPTQKARIVRLLRAAGRTVAMTGDGANDVPAITLAHVGIALGSRATPAARESADLVVIDDRIETITHGIVEGRGMWASVHDALSMLLGGNLGEIGYAVGAGVFSSGAALNARQLLVVNMLTDVLPAIAIAVRPPARATPEKLLTEGPEASLGAALTRSVYVRAGATASAAGLAWALARPVSLAGQARTTGLVALVSAQLVQTLAVRGRTPLVLASGAVSFAMLFGVVQIPGLSHFFGSSPLLPHQWGIALGSAVATTVVVLLLQNHGAPEHKALPGPRDELSGPSAPAVVPGTVEHAPARS
ncbi:cation-translocating P-type ATPase [Bounagaea algeriensis]